MCTDEGVVGDRALMHFHLYRFKILQEDTIEKQKWITGKVGRDPKRSGVPKPVFEKKRERIVSYCWLVKWDKNWD